LKSCPFWLNFILPAVRPSPLNLINGNIQALHQVQGMAVCFMTRSKKKNLPAGQQDDTPVEENNDPGTGKWVGDEDLFSIPEAIEITDEMRSQWISEEQSIPPAPAALPPRREESELSDDSQAKEPLDLSRIVSSNEYNKGHTRARPLSSGRKISGGRDPERKQFIKGQLSRLVERGVVHPNPVRLVLTAILLLLSKFFLTAIIVTSIVLVITNSVKILPEVLPFVFAFIPIGLGFLIAASKARCRICSCPLFYVRLCRKHRAAHYVPLVGIACSTALHLLVFKWMRCMYCGTAIRLRHRPPSSPAASSRQDNKPVEDEY
jgi:hypothetical protein